jgi:hypothetical protein
VHAVTFAGPGLGLVRFRLVPRSGERGSIAYTGELQVFVRTSGAEFTAVREVAVFREDVVRFRDELADLLDGASGTATLEPLSDFRLDVTFGEGRGELGGYVEDEAIGLRLGFGGIATAESYLSLALRELSALLEAPPEDGG